jgi:hypothetical protein
MESMTTETELGTLYDELKASGVTLDSHESDLYVKATPEATAILARHNVHERYFTNQQDGQRWIDIPFAFIPFWDKVANLSKKENKHHD